MALIASTTLPQQPGKPPQFRIRVPRVDAYFTGTGRCLQPHLLVAGLWLDPAAACRTHVLQRQPRSEQQLPKFAWQSLTCGRADLPASWVRE